MSKKLTTEEFIQKAKQIHGNKYDYSKTQYINIHEDVCIICYKHGEFWQRADNHICKRYGCPKCKTEKVGNLKRKSLEQFVEDARKIHGNKYDYSKAEYINAHTKLEIVCPKHGSFWQNPDDHLSDKKCPICALEENRGTKEQFIENARKIHGYKYDYSKVEYINSNTPICIICPKHGEFWQKPHNHLIGKGCKKCGNSKGEERIARVLENKNIKFIHDEACLDFLGELRPDFYLPDYNLIIEYDGEQHFKPIEIFGGIERFKKTQKLDALKACLCEEHNIKLIRISYTQFDEIEKIIDSIIC